MMTRKYGEYYAKIVGKHIGSLVYFQRNIIIT